MVDLPRTLPASERYSYVYEGNSQVLDHILVSPALTTAPHGPQQPAYDYDIVHTNAEFHDQDSDHDPQVVRLAIRPGQGLTATGPDYGRADGARRAGTIARRALLCPA